MADPAYPRGPLCTIETLKRDFSELGIANGDTIIVHASLSKLGWVNGGAEAVVRALLHVLGDSGTLVVPTHTANNSWPDDWKAPPVPVEWLEDIKETMPPFDVQTSRSRDMGVMAETVRTWPGALRSNHPRCSFAAIGAKAGEITRGHDLADVMGDKTPLGALDRLGAKILLLGVGFEKCTAFHLAEHRIPGYPKTREGSRIWNSDGRAEWVFCDTIKLDDGSSFAKIGQALEDEGRVTRGRIGAASSALLSLSEGVRYAQRWLETRP